MKKIFEFLKRHPNLVITTHDTADPDGLGAEKVFFQIAQTLCESVRIVNSSPIPEKYRFMDPDKLIETWEDAQADFPRGAALAILDTADEYNIGDLKEFIPGAAEVFVIDHHELNRFNTLSGYIDPSASSTSELIVELAALAELKLKPENAAAAFAGIAYDTGFFAYNKTTSRTFRAALRLSETGVNTYDIYRKFYESASTGALLLEKAIISTLEIKNRGRVAVQVLRKKDLDETGAKYEDSEGFVNMPMKSRDVEVSILLKEHKEGTIRCSLRSKGNVNVSKLAQTLGGGGHVTAAGFKSQLPIEETMELILQRVDEALGER